MSVIVNKYRIWCVTENAYVYGWSETEPTTCPNNTSHTIDETKTTIDASVEEGVVEIKEENTPTGGHYRALGVTFDAPNGETTEHDFSIPYAISLLSATIPTNDLSSGDVAAFDVSPDTLIGSITSDVTIGDTVINVSSTVIDNISVGRCLILDDGVNYERHVVTALSSDTVTIDVGTTYGYAAVTPTYCKMSVCMSHNIEISRGSRVVLGESKIGGSYIPANTTMRISYTNNGDSLTRVILYIEFLY